MIERSKSRHPHSFDDGLLPKNTLSKERELEIDKMMLELLPEAFEKLKNERSAFFREVPVDLLNRK